MKIPEKLQPGDEIRVIAPSRSLSIVRQSSYEGALRHLTEQGFRVTFGDRAREVDRWHSSSAEARVADLHDAFADPNVKAILTAIGGFNVNQILSLLDYDLIGRNPKILCGFFRYHRPFDRHPHQDRNGHLSRPAFFLFRSGKGTKIYLGYVSKMCDGVFAFFSDAF